MSKAAMKQNILAESRMLPQTLTDLTYLTDLTDLTDTRKPKLRGGVSGTLGMGVKKTF